MDKEEFNKLFGEFVRTKRLSKGWDQSDLADKLGNNFQNVSRLERGEVSPTMFWTTSLAAAFDMKLSKLTAEFEEFVVEKRKVPSKHIH